MFGPQAARIFDRCRVEPILKTEALWKVYHTGKLEVLRFGE